MQSCRAKRRYRGCGTGSFRQGCREKTGPQSTESGLGASAAAFLIQRAALLRHDGAAFPHDRQRENAFRVCKAFRLAVIAKKTANSGSSRVTARTLLLRFCGVRRASEQTGQVAMVRPRRPRVISSTASDEIVEELIMSPPAIADARIVIAPRLLPHCGHASVAGCSPFPGPIAAMPAPHLWSVGSRPRSAVICCAP